jgi:uncharacterized lipoprotein YajG
LERRLQVISNAGGHRENMMLKKTLIATAPVLLLSGCGRSSALVQNPKTNEVALCDADAPPLFVIVRQARVDSCVDAYVKQGWVRK